MENLILPKYTIAIGAEGLAQELERLWEQSQQDLEFASEDYYILYQLGEQKSFIKIDMRHKPYQFWYNDLLGRPITRIVKETIARFLWEKFGEKEQYEKIKEK